MDTEEELLVQASINLENHKYSHALNQAISAHRFDTSPSTTSKLIAIEIQCLEELNKSEDCRALIQKTTTDPKLLQGYELVVAAGSWAIYKEEWELGEKVLGGWYDWVSGVEEEGGKGGWKGWMVEECLGLYFRVLWCGGKREMGEVLLEEDGVVGKVGVERVRRGFGVWLKGVEESDGVCGEVSGGKDLVDVDVTSTVTDKSRRSSLNEDKIPIEDFSEIEATAGGIIDDVQNGGSEVVRCNEVTLGPLAIVVASFDEVRSAGTINEKVLTAWRIVKRTPLPPHLQKAAMVLGVLTLLVGLIGSSRRRRLYKYLVALKVSLIQSIRVAFGLEYGRWVF